MCKLVVSQNSRQSFSRIGTSGGFIGNMQIADLVDLSRSNCPINRMETSSVGEASLIRTQALRFAKSRSSRHGSEAQQLQYNARQ